MSNEFLELDTLGKEIVLQSTWLFNCLLGGGKIQREGIQAILHLGASTPRCQVMVKIVALCLPTIASATGRQSGHWCLETNEIKNIKKKKKWKMHLIMNKYLVLKMPLNQHAAAITFVSDTD